MNSDKNAAEDVLEFIKKMSYQYDSELIAALLVISGFRMYRTMFENDDEYNMICKKIYEDRDRVGKY